MLSSWLYVALGDDLIGLVEHNLRAIGAIVLKKRKNVLYPQDPALDPVVMDALAQGGTASRGVAGFQQETSRRARLGRFQSDADPCLYT